MWARFEKKDTSILLWDDAKFDETIAKAKEDLWLLLKESGSDFESINKMDIFSYVLMWLDKNRIEEIKPMIDQLEEIWFRNDGFSESYSKLSEYIECEIDCFSWERFIVAQIWLIVFKAFLNRKFGNWEAMFENLIDARDYATNMQIKGVVWILNQLIKNC